MKKLLFVYLIVLLALSSLASPCDSIKVYIRATDTLVCEGDEVILEAIVEGTAKSAQFVWSTAETSKSIAIMADKDKSIKLETYVSGCPEPFEAIIDIEPIKISSPVQTTYNHPFFKFQLRAPTEIRSTYSVTFNEIICDTCVKNINEYRFAFKNKGLYKIIFTHEKQACINHDTIEIDVIQDLNFLPHIPNIIVPEPKTPTNVRFKPYSDLLTEYEIFVFSRRGNRLFHCHELYCFWDGRDKKGEIVPSDHYYYLINTTDIFGERKSYKGTVFVMH